MMIGIKKSTAGKYEYKKAPIQKELGLLITCNNTI